MPNLHLETMITHVTDDSLTSTKKTTKVCIAFAAWAKDVRDSSTSFNAAEQLKDLDINSLKSANILLHSPEASLQITNMFSSPAFADTMLQKLDQMIQDHITALDAAARFVTVGSSKPLPKPPGRSASAAAATPTLFSASSRSATSDPVRTLSLAPKPNIK